MRYFLPFIALAFFALTGCGGSVDREALNAQIAAAEAKVAQIDTFIRTNQPLVEQLAKLAADTKDPKLQAAAEVLRASVAEAVRILPTAQAELAEVKTTVAGLEADAAGKVPWYAVAGGLALHYVPKVVSLIFPQLAPIAALFSNFSWALSATKKQKEEEAAVVAKAKEA